MLYFYVETYVKTVIFIYSIYVTRSLFELNDENHSLDHHTDIASFLWKEPFFFFGSYKIYRYTNKKEYKEVLKPDIKYDFNLSLGLEMSRAESNLAELSSTR